MKCETTVANNLHLETIPVLSYLSTLKYSFLADITVFTHAYDILSHFHKQFSLTALVA